MKKYIIAALVVLSMSSATAQTPADTKAWDSYNYDMQSYLRHNTTANRDLSNALFFGLSDGKMTPSDPVEKARVEKAWSEYVNRPVVLNPNIK